MSQKLQPARGTKDLLPEDFRKNQHVIQTARNIGKTYGFEEMATPIFEFTEVFKRTLGDTSDVVSKEMYTFEDRGGESITLRPEFTAGIARSFISNGLSQNVPCKFFSTGPLFRYERPQKGRFRQFHQINFELLGAATPQADIEVISMGAHILETLGVSDSITLELNSLGDKETRDNYRTALVSYLEGFKDKLSEDSKKRLEVNPMRILDSKDEGDKAIVADAPSMADYYSEATQSFFDAVKNGLDRLGIAYTVNPKLVRGLDYYSHTAFEFTTNALGSQNTVLAGGRYDALIGIMGGADTPSVGFAGGVERIAALLEQEIAAPRPVVLIPIGERAENECLLLAHALRKEGIIIEMGYNGNAGKRMKKANKMNAVACVVIGDDELDNNIAKVRDMDKGTENDVPTEGLIDMLAQYKG